ncbi:MLO-like protein 8-like [Trifolium pratense]|uniref:MLO-like protein n=1 Tax=Trifolium pratense TaxID=57577 RepID=A0A2K3PEF2_TRIPR|nr:MLO-like protein 8-like [Trifolium pratense]
MLPCPLNNISDNKKSSSDEVRNLRKLVSYERRYLASDTTSYKCSRKGHEPLLSVNGLHQLHILIFFLAVFHVFYSAVTMLLGRLKIRGWKQWEEEASTNGYDNGAARFRLSHETSFVCFFRQFYRSVRKVDYQTLRNGFINVHLAPGSKFNFQKYIKRSLEDDFKVVVGVSPVLWASAVVFLLLNIDGWRTPLWAFLIPIIIILAVGTKLQVILARMALEIAERHAVVQGMPLVQGSDRYFWFGQPQFVLHLIHFALFQYSFGLENCFRLDLKLAIIKVAFGILMLCLCSYITLPLYALVTQMGSRMKKSVFDEQTSKALKQWHMTVKKKQRTVKLGKSTIGTIDGSSIGSTTQSPGPALHRFKTTGHSTRSSTFEEHDEYELSDNELAKTNLIVRVDHDGEQQVEDRHHSEGEANNDEFTFFKHNIKSLV